MHETWTKSSFSANSSECVEVLIGDLGQVLVRDTKTREDGILAFTQAEWHAFVQGVKEGEFDL